MVKLCSCVRTIPFDFNIHQTYHTKVLIFDFFSSYSDDEKEHFYEILSAVAKSGLKQSLTHINIHDCGFKVPGRKRFQNQGILYTQKELK